MERSYSRGDGALEVDLGGLSAEQVDHLEIGWPSSRLLELVLIDTPGIASISTDVSLRTHRVMTAEEGHAPVADAVMYLLRHTHSSDVRFLESFHDDEVARGTPVNTVGVLSRADEIGSSRVDAMQVADRIARRYQAEPRLHRLCPIVIPVNGSSDTPQQRCGRRSTRTWCESAGPPTRRSPTSSSPPTASPANRPGSRCRPNGGPGSWNDSGSSASDCPWS